MTPSPEFAEVFAALRGILQRNQAGLSVSEDSSTCYCLQGGAHPKHKTPIPVAWVKTSKGYVSFHHIGVYAFPELLQNISKELRARMQGKSCFNFKKLDSVLFGELEALTVRAFEAFRRAGFKP